MQLGSEFALLEKPEIAWGNQKRPATYSLAGQGLVLINGTCRTIEPSGRLSFA
jgi:hypothetical protein